MSKVKTAEEFIKHSTLDFRVLTDDERKRLEDFMRAYASHVLEVAAERVSAKSEWNDIHDCFYAAVDKDSILDIKKEL